MCEECGAPGDACEARFHECLAREFENPRYGKVHHLTVSVFMLQHSSKLSRDGWLYERELLREFLLGQKLPGQIRQENSDLVDSGKRRFKFKSRDGLPVIPSTKWSKNILDVRTEHPQEYCEDVAAWAKASLADAERIAL